jgi:hypothetical protein
MQGPPDELSTLREELAALRAEVSELQRELRGARAHVDLTMRGQLRCRACGCRRIAHALKILDRGDGDARYELALYQRSWWVKKTTGKLEAYACTGCGLVEWWVKDPGALDPDPEHLEILDAGPDGADNPYR